MSTGAGWFNEEPPRTRDELLARMGEDGVRRLQLEFVDFIGVSRCRLVTREVLARDGLHDAENRFDFSSAVHVARGLEALSFRWFEAPFRDYDIRSYQRLRKLTRIPLVPHGLWLFDLQEIPHYVSYMPWDAIRFDATMVGGITGARKIATLGEAFGLLVEPQSWGYSLVQAPNLHIALACGLSSYFELPVPYEPDEFAVLNPIRCDQAG
jgi:L-alanine-DL-glutamate epimerase-like enolase superfamily enzyme